MLFNSISYAIFLPLVFTIYWAIGGKRLRLQNIFLLTVSYYFYSCWDWRFLFLLVFSTFLDYFCGIKIENAVRESSRKFWLWLSIIVSLGFLGIFKYYNFFAVSFAEFVNKLGFEIHPTILKIVLPVGISFYTFHGLSYVIDIYKRKISAEKNFVNYALFVSFFALLVAGPIERATHLLPQIKKFRVFDYSQAIDGLRQILWGLFKKIVIADNCAQFANQIFNDYQHYSGSDLLIGAFFFTVQIYGDFSGYSDIALGSARLLGFNLLKNFSYPYFSRDIAEFWRRWHISLSTWFRDYLYIPLGGSRGGIWSKIRNTFIIFLVSGFWHGANWTFIAWGALNAFYFLPLLLSKSNRANLDIVAKGRTFPSFREFTGIVLTFILTLFAWVFFRSPTIVDAFHYITNIFTTSILNVPSVLPKGILLLVAFFFAIEWKGREGNFALHYFGLQWNRYIRLSFYSLLVFLIFWFGGSQQQFIYFQF